MGKLRFMGNSGWVDACAAKIRVLGENRVWRDVDPNTLSARNGSSEYWIPVECEQSATTTCSILDDYACWPGFSGVFDGGSVEGNTLWSCDKALSVTYDGISHSLDKVPKAFSSSGYQAGIATLPATFYSSGAQVTEIALEGGTLGGVYSLEWSGASRVRVYQNCEVVFDSFLVSGTNSGFMYDPELGNMILRVEGVSWIVRFENVNSEFPSSFSDPLPDAGTHYVSLPCTTLVNAVREFVVMGYGLHHFDVVGNVTLALIQNGVVLLQRTITNEDDEGVITSFSFMGLAILRLTGEGGAGITLRAQRDTLRGSRANMANCCTGTASVCDGFVAVNPACRVVGKGAAITDVFYTFDEDGEVIASFVFPANGQLLIYRDNTLVKYTNQTQGAGMLSFRVFGSVPTMLRVLTDCCAEWEMSVSCGVGNAQVFIDDAYVARDGAGINSIIRFPITLSGKTDRVTTLQVKTYPITALEDTQGDTSKDYAFTEGTVTIPSCQQEGFFDVVVYGTDTVFNDRTMKAVIVSANVDTGQAEAIGTLITTASLGCQQGAAAPVYETNECPYVGNGAYRLHVKSSIYAQGAAAYTIDRTVNVATAGTYQLKAFASNYAEVYVDCALVLVIQNLNGNEAQTVDLFLDAGDHYVYINFGTRPTSQQMLCYAAMSLSLNGAVTYASRAPDWLGLTRQAGNELACSQFAQMCFIEATGTAQIASAANNDTNIGYPTANRIASSLHNPRSTPGNSYYVLEREFTFDVAGAWQFVGTADDDLWFYMDCIEQFYFDITTIGGSGDVWRQTFTKIFNVPVAGTYRINVMYRNRPNNTNSWVKFVLLKPNSDLFYASDADEWISKHGYISDLPVIPSETALNGTYVIHLNSSRFQGPDGVWTSEATINLPDEGWYDINVNATHDASVYVGCVQVGSRAYLGGGSQLVTLRLVSALNVENWFALTITNGTYTWTARAQDFKSKASDTSWGLING